MAQVNGLTTLDSFFAIIVEKHDLSELIIPNSEIKNTSVTTCTTSTSTSSFTHHQFSFLKISLGNPANACIFIVVVFGVDTLQTAQLFITTFFPFRDKRSICVFFMK